MPVGQEATLILIHVFLRFYFILNYEYMCMFLLRYVHGIASVQGG